ncbi:DOMON-like domain-containing protein [Tepidiphilus olei]|uniref:DOMON-like domain-containing protein n=1 Tax=Tepidiphilus olei TaxID=2502184 RepID=UPI00115E5E4C|nr:DOMON-like domain-containing protein [Tepidiphilus olei]
MRVALHPHPESAALGEFALEVELERQDGALVLGYTLRGEVERLRVPGAGAVLPPQRLWAHTCFELFFAREGSGGYREFNFSPSGQWAFHAFSAYREPTPAPRPPAPRLRWQRAPGRLGLRVRLAPASLPAGEGALRLGLTAVLEGKVGAFSWWALAHPPGRPDFHAPEGFALRWEE